MTASDRMAGGADRYFFDLLKAFQSDQIHTNALVAGSSRDVVAMPDVATYAGEEDALPAKWLKLRRAAKPLVRSCDVVVSHFAAYTVALIGSLHRKPLVVHFHGPWALEAKAEGAGSVAVAIKRQIERLVYRNASRVVVLSQAFGDIAVAEYGVARDRIRVIPGGVDLARFAPATSRENARESLGLPANRPTVVTARRLIKAKGIENLLGAASILRERIPNVLVAIAGTGPLAASLQRSIEERGLGDTVRLLGRVPEAELPQLYRAGDVFIVPTITLEGFGLVVVEALAAGTPALVTPVGGLPEAVRGLPGTPVLDGVEPKHLAAGLAETLLRTHRVPTEDECLSHARAFGWSDIARRVTDVYREVA